MRIYSSFISITELEKLFNSSNEDAVNFWMPVMKMWTSKIESIVQRTTVQRPEKRECAEVDLEV